MRTPLTRNAIGLATVLVVALVVCTRLWGCNSDGAGLGRTGGSGAATPEEIRREALRNTEPNVLRVIAYYQPPYRWMWTDDKTRVRGLVIGALYLEGPQRKGVFGDGVISTKLFVRDRRSAKPGEQYTLIKEWRFPPEDTLALRTKRPTIQGHGYMLPLNWDDLNVDLGGQEIRVVIGYERTDGFHVPGSTKDLIVPGRGS